MSRRRSLTEQETDIFSKTRREYIPVGSVAASLLLTVLVNMSVSCTKPTDIVLGKEEIGTGYRETHCMQAHATLPLITHPKCRSIQHSAPSTCLTTSPGGTSGRSNMITGKPNMRAATIFAYVASPPLFLLTKASIR